MENLVTEELGVMPQTYEIWKGYLESDKSVQDFNRVVSKFTEEIRLDSYRNYRFEHFFTELVVWTIKSLKTGSSDTNSLLKAYRVCLKFSIFNKAYVEELIEALFKALNLAFTCKEAGKQFESVLETFKTLALASEKIIHLKDVQAFKDTLKKTIIELLNWVDALKNEKIHKRFLAVIRKLVTRENSSVFSTALLDKKCALAIIGIIKYYFFESFLFSDLKPLSEEELIFELYYFLVQGYQNNLVDLRLEEIVSQLLNNDQNFGIVVNIFDGLLKRSMNSGQDSLESRKIVLDLVLNLEVDKEISFKVFKKLQKLSWSSDKLPDYFQREIKSLILSSRCVAKNSFYLELITPLLNQHISVQDLKLLTRLCYKSPQLNSIFFSYMIEVSKHSKTLIPFFQTSSENCIAIFPFYNITSTKEFSIWTKIQPTFSSCSNTFFSVQLNKSITLDVILNTHNFKVEMTKGKKTITIMNTHIMVNENVWNTIGICFYLRQKIEGRWKIAVNINEFGIEMWTEEIGGLKELSWIKVIGNGKIEFVNLYSNCITKEEFLEKNRENCGELKKFEVFGFSAQKLEMKNVKFECKATKMNFLGLADLLVTVGGVNFLLPLLRKSDEFEVFDLFFKILIELCDCKNFEELFDNGTFIVIKQILIEKAYLINMDWLEMCESFFIALKSPKIYKLALELMYCCVEPWVNLLDESLESFLETVKNRIKSLKCEITQAYLELITTFYSDLCNKVNKESKKMVLGSFFQIFSIFFKYIEINSRLRLFTSTLKQLFTSVSISEGIQEQIMFIKEVLNKKWVVESVESLKKLQELGLQAIECESLELASWFLALYLNLTRKFYKNQVLNWSKEEKIKFIRGKIANLVQFTKPFIQPQICQVVCQFLTLDKVINTSLIFLEDVLIDSLYRTYITNKSVFCEVCEILTTFCSKTREFSKSFCTRSSFPGFFFCFFQESDKISEKILQLICTLFIHLENFSNFDNLREILYELIGTKNISTVFSILIEIFINCFPKAQCEPMRLKYFFEIFNVVEDVLFRIAYESLPKDLFLEFLALAVLPLKSFEFSISFPNIPGFGALNFVDRKEDELCKNFIVLREGGLVRQILQFLFIGLSFGPNMQIEAFFDKFLKEKENNSDERTEWKSLVTDQTVKKSKILVMGKNFTCQNLIYIYIFAEWTEIIKSYEERFESSLIKDSLSNLLCFVQNSRLGTRIQEEGNKGLSKDVFKNYERSLNDNLDCIESIYIRENINSIRQLHTTLSTNSYNNIDEKSSNKQETLLMKTHKLSVKLEACQNEQALKSILSKFTKNYEVTHFFILLTSFKMKSISQFYTSRDIDYRYVPLSINYENTTSVSRISPNTKFSDYEFIFHYSKIESQHLQLCGLWKATVGILTVKSIPDAQGRRIFSKKKRRNEYFSVDSFINLQDLNESEDIINRNLSFSVISSEKNSIFAQTFISQTLLDLDCVLNTINLCETSEFECEIITIKGSLYGQLHLYDEFLVFIGKNTPKPNFAIFKVEEGKKVFYSSALPELQILKEVKKIWSVCDLEFYQPRNFVQNLSALEIFSKCGKSVFFNFFSYPQLELVCQKFKEKYEHKGVTLKCFREILKYRKMWQTGQITNFQYLLLLNQFAGRSFHDLNQYPIFPWVLKDYTSPSLNLQNETSYRNFSFPCSSQTLDSLERSKHTFNLSKQGIGSGYHHGSFYSSAGIVLDYLVRIQPYTDEAKKLHNDSFDSPDRIFSSISNSWEQLNSSFGTNRELIPEFFYLPEMFFNFNNEELGEKQNGDRVWDVEMPSWAKQNVFLFLNKHRLALESEFVSENLNCWIDLIFGCKQRNRAAEEGFNVYHPICYSENYKKLVEEAPDELKKAYFYQAYHFGQIPFQIFSDPHPKRDEFRAPRSVFERLLLGTSYDLQKKFQSSNSFIPLCTNEYMILIKVNVKITVTIYKLTAIGVFDLHSVKENVLEGVLSTFYLLADIFEGRFIVTSGYIDFSVAVHSLNGELQRIFHFHTMKTTALLAGKWIVSASEDSTLTLWTDFSNSENEVNWNNNHFHRLHGHLSSIHSVAGIYDSCLLASSSSYILLHHSKTLEILNKIQEPCEKLLCNPSNFIFCLCENELKIFYINGSCIKTIPHSKFKPFFVFSEFLVLEQNDSLQIISPLEDFKEKQIFFPESLDVLQILHCHTNTSLDFYFSFKKDSLLIQSSQNTLFSLDAQN